MVEIIDVLEEGSTSIVEPAKFFYKDGISRTVALKSTEIEDSSCLRRESITLKKLEGCSEYYPMVEYGVMVACSDDTQSIYSRCLEYVPCCSIANLLKSGPLNEERVRSYTKSMLKGLAHIHTKGYVHCNLNPENILVCGQSDVKIVDFGHEKQAGEKKEGFEPYEIQCTPPDCVISDEYEPPMDIWALGCVVVEMITGKPVVKFDENLGLHMFLEAIGESKVQPEIPEENLSEEGIDFLRKCFVRDPTLRWTAEMLLKHPFVLEEYEDFPHMDMINELLADE